MKTYEIASILLGLDHPFNPLWDEQLAPYETTKAAIYQMTVRFVEEIEVQEEVKDYHSLMKVHEGKDKKVIYTFNKKAVPISRVELSNDLKRITIFLSNKLGDNLFMMEYIVTGLYFLEIALSCGYLPLHASAIIYQNEALLFSAPSGVGKSTQANLWKKNIPEIVFLNDDKPLILCKDQALVFGTPWSGKTFRNVNVSAALKTIVFLKQGPINEIISLSDEDKMIHLFKNTHRSQILINQEVMIESIKHLIGRTKIIAYSCTPNQDAFTTLYLFLYGKEYGTKNNLN
ncbi:MAG TPA: hypothetical protein PK087_02075 [Bacilli bacterium]|nr:MAG: hypothetical protein BWY97_01128 [Tenericutes bacterium ADurb.BinA124]HOH18091.1 hypothetical protein [Bacilli bacterium]HPX84493.1 hypothetical protein [Bacilli bacterium]HQC74619.1 hypothetical protein [Bacilli bacterium]